MHGFVFIFFGLLLAAHAQADGDGEVQRLRITETSITEVGRVSGLHPIKIKTKGYGLTYIHQSGVGLSYTFLTSSGSGPNNNAQNEIELKHNYADLTYTYGDRFILTGGLGVGLSGDGRFNAGDNVDQTADWKDSKSMTLGPGFAIGWFEIYWIHRRNWIAYQIGPDKRTLASQHYMLGLGAHW